MRRFARFVCLGLGAAGGLVLTGCAPTGTYDVSWTFFTSADGTGGPELASSACGRHGVDGILIKGTSGGNSASRAALCTPGAVSGVVAPGDWTFQIQGLDVHGGLLTEAVTTMTLTVSEGATQIFPSVTLRPPPECSDGVDNDGDGLVDKDDPGCANFDPNDPKDPTLESAAGPGSTLDGGPPPDGGAGDGGTADGMTADGMTPDVPADGPDVDGQAPDVGTADADGADGGTADAGLPDDAAAGG